MTSLFSDILRRRPGNGNNHKVANPELTEVSNADSNTIALRRSAIGASSKHRRRNSGKEMLNYWLSNWFCVGGPEKAVFDPRHRRSARAVARKSLGNYSRQSYSVPPSARRTSVDHQVISSVTWCISTIEAGEDEELKAIYLQNGKFSVIQSIGKSLENGTEVQDDAVKDLRAVGGYLKRLIRRCHFYPIIPDELYSELVDACNDFAKTHSCVKLRYTLRKLPPVNYDVAKLLMTHFWHITEHRHLALISPVSLAIAWTPNFFDMNSLTGHLKSSDLAVYEASLAVAIRNFITETIISQAGVIFQD